MTRPFTLAFLLAILSLTPPNISAQIFYPPVYGPPPFQPPSDPVHYPIEIGEYVTIGGASNSTPGTQGAYAAGTVGLYAQWNRYGLCPGLDLRIQGNSSDLHGYLVGPRVVYQPRGKMNPFRPYAEALFGKNETLYSTATPGILDPTFNSITGTTAPSPSASTSTRTPPSPGVSSSSPRATSQASPAPTRRASPPASFSTCPEITHFRRTGSAMLYQGDRGSRRDRLRQPREIT